MMLASKLAGFKSYLILLAGCAVLGAAAFALGMVRSDGRQDDETKREVLRDNPNPATPADAPPGEAFPDGIDSPRAFGNLLLVPEGQDPGRVLRSGDAGTTVSEIQLSGADYANWFMSVGEDALPEGYSLPSNATATVLTYPDGTERVTDFRFVLLGPGHPIRVTWFVNPYSDGWTVAAWVTPPVMTTMGEIANKPAAFYHKRLGVETAEPQKIYVDDNGAILAVESNVDMFSSLMAIADSAMSSLPAERGLLK